MDDAYHLIATVPKNSREELRVGLSEYRGSPFVDLRIFADVGGDERRPTKAGVTVRPDRLGEVIDALLAAKREAECRGRIGG